MVHGRLKDSVDVLAGVLAVGSWWEYLPEISAGLGAIWLLIRIFEWARVRLFGKEAIDLKI